LIEVLPAHKK